MTLASVLKEYRNRYNLTQQQLAENLSVDERTLRRWENRETILNDMGELRRIAAALGVDAEKLGVAGTVVIMTDEQAEEILRLVWKLIKEGRVYEARTIAERLVEDLQTNALHPGSYQHLWRLTHAHHAAAYAKAMNTRNSEIRYPLASYAEMEKTARQVNDATLLAIALTYEGDMHARKGEIEKGLKFLEAAVNTAPEQDIATKGNAVQLLARGYLKAGRVKQFERFMARAEELAGQLTDEGITQGQYGLKSVYEEYAKSYALRGEMQKALEYVWKAQQVPAYDKHWEIVLKTTTAMALVCGEKCKAG